MKKFSAFMAIEAALVVLAAFCFVKTADCRMPSIYLSGGLSDPNGDLASSMEVGYHGAAKIGFQLEPKTEFLIGAEYHSMRTDHNRLPDVNANFRAILVGFDLKINLKIPEDPITPYLVFGGGYANIDFSDTLTLISGLIANSDSHSYFELGGGFEVKKAFALMKLVNIFTEHATARFFSIGIGYKFN